MTWNLSKALMPHRQTNRHSSTANRRKSRPTLEFLEGRALLATFTWTGGGGNGNWDNGANWQGGSAPTSGTADIVLNQNATQTITLQGVDGTFEISSIDVQQGTYTLKGPAAGSNQLLTLSNNATINTQALTTLNIGTSGDTSLKPNFKGTVTYTGPGSLVLNTAASGYVGAPSPLYDFNVNGTILTLGPTNLAQSRIALTNSGKVFVNDGASPTIGSIKGPSGSVVQIGTNGTNRASTGLTISTPQGVNDQLSGNVTGTGGTITKTGAGIWTLFNINPNAPSPTFDLTVQAGTLGLQGSNSSIRSTTIGSNGTLNSTLRSGGASGKITATGTTNPMILAGNLSLDKDAAYTPTVGDNFTIISSPNGITGKFANAPENGLVYLPTGNVAFRVNYTTTAVTITAVAKPALIATTSTMTPMNPVAPGSTVTFSATVRDASNNPVPGKGYFGFWYSDDFLSWQQLGTWVAVGANGVATSASRTLPLTYTAGAVVGFYIDNQAPVIYSHSWTQDSGSILFPIVQWYHTNTALVANSTNNTLTATITSPDGTPTWLGQKFAGAVLFKQNGVVIGAAQIVNGVAVLNWSSFRRGTTFTAEYIPDAGFSVIASTRSVTV